MLYGQWDPILSVKPWAPAALTDQTATNGGWDAASYYLTLQANAYSDAGDEHDGDRFLEDDVIRIIQAAQTDPTSTAYGFAALVVDYYDSATRRLYLKKTPTLTGWTTAIEHVILFDDWTAVTTDQKGRGTWQADTSTMKINTDAPYLYG